MRTRLILTACLMTMLVAARLWAEGCYVVDKGGNRIGGDSLTANEEGDLQLKIKGAVRTFKRGTYRYGYVPKPRQVELLEKAFEQERYDLVKEKAPEIFDTYKYLGWGDLISYWYGQAYIAEKNPAEALRKFEEGERYAGPHVDALAKGKVTAYLDLGKDKEAGELLGKLKGSPNDGVAAFGFYASGRLLEKDGKKKEAVLQYLKTVLLFEPGGSVAVERQQAKAAAAALLKQMGDPRHEQIAQME